MLFLLFRIGDGLFALPSNQVVEVVPAVDLKAIPGVPEYVAGFMNYRSSPVPVIDVSAMASGRPCARRYSTRIIVLEYPISHNRTALLGMMVERATDAVREGGEVRFVSPGIRPRSALYLGDVAPEPGLVQKIEARQILPDHVHALLFHEADPEE